MIQKIDIKNKNAQFILTALLGGFLGIFSALSLLTFSHLPQVEQLQNYEPQGITQLKDQAGNVVYEFYREKRIPLRFEEIPIMTRKTFLAAEDWNFYNHFGIDVFGIIRAVGKNILRGRLAQGASTITQQLSRVLFLSPEKTMARKVREVLLTFRIENRFTKDEILQLYLNQIYLGEGTYGIEAASEKYFGKHVKDLSIAENAMLASLPKAPSLYSPFKDPEKALRRRNLIIKILFEKDLITEKQFAEAVKEPLPVESANNDTKQNYFTFNILQELTETINLDQIYRGKIQIQSTLDSELQKKSEEILDQGLKAYAKRHKIQPTQLDKLPQVAMIAMDINTGDIRAMIGGRSFAESQFNRALQALRQPGSSFKPFLYGFALEKGYTQSTSVLDAPIEYNNAISGKWTPENYDDKYDGYIPFRIALEKSKNMPTIRILQDVGIAPFTKWMSRFQLTSKLAGDLTIALGSSSMKLIELARSYAIIGNGGYWLEPNYVTSVKDENGKELWETKSEAKSRVMDESTANILSDMLRGVMQTGTGRFANADLSCEVAGKTGTTNKYVDSVFVGFSSELVILVWMGFDQRKSLGFGETGAQAAGSMWKPIMQFHCNERQPESLSFSNSVEWVDVDHETGLLPSSYSVNVLKEAFVPSTAPDKDCCVENYYGPTKIEEPVSRNE